VKDLGSILTYRNSTCTPPSSSRNSESPQNIDISDPPKLLSILEQIQKREEARRSQEAKEKESKEYLVRFRGESFRNVVWVSGTWLKRRYPTEFQNFWEMVDRDTVLDPYQLWPKSEGEVVRKEWREVDRIVGARWKDEAAGQFRIEDCGQVLVLWKCLGYEFASWEMWDWDNKADPQCGDIGIGRDLKAAFGEYIARIEKFKCLADSESRNAVHTIEAFDMFQTTHLSQVADREALR
jgi:hypothetical protein